ncbi:MAG TPA: biosynthetic-type acetolactate synthase large subunit [bacterium]|nr:biosynthetic-type acetolactate synthase large subunit [bacterium]HQI49162.1 biosynthetic-type acetolactate synthase large subunit [bacterium]HQJ63977.1 biosynthetic-type acetolactate synthase large subunit [bacterium]
MTGAEMIIHALRQEGVRALFGYPGGMVIDIFDQLYRSGFPFYLTRHEQGAVHAADGFARASGEVGVCLATSGPGATNLVTGLATAYMDSIPLVAITGQVPTHLIGNDAFQEADMLGITRSITKHNYLVKEVDELPRLLKSAFYIARSGRPGPVLIDIPKDVQQASTEVPYPEQVSIRSYKPTLNGHLPQIQKAAARINRAERPVVFAGGGVLSSGASDELGHLARTLQAPVTTSLMGLGAFPETDPLALKMVGMHGTAYANYAIQEADLLIAIGVRFDDRVTGKVSKFAPKADIIHIDIDPATIRKNVKVAIPVVGDIKCVLTELNQRIEPRRHDAWLETIASWKRDHPLQYTQNGGISPQAVIRTLAEMTRHEAIIATEVGQNQMWSAQFFDFVQPRSWISSGGLGTMGFGFPAAIGAQIAHPDKLVIDIAGDGSIQMNIQELATAALYHLPVKIIILNNRSLGMVRQWQAIFYQRRFSGICLNRDARCPEACDGRSESCPVYLPDFVKLAAAYNIPGYRSDQPGEVRPLLEKAFAHDGPVIVEFVISAEENVFPMVPAGAGLNEMMRGMA